MTSSCPNRPLLRAGRGRFLSAVFILLGSLALSLTSVVEARAQEPTPTPSADLTVTKSGDEAARVGGTITYNLVVTNGGPDTATNVVLTDPIPEHTTFVSAESPYPKPTPTPDPPEPGGVVSFSNNTLTVTFDSIPAFESRSARLTVRVNPDVTRGTIISNTVTGTSDAADPQPGDNSATALTYITGPFAGDILISEFRLRGPAGANDEFIEIYNNSATPHSVRATDDSAGYAVAASDGVIRCTIPNGTLLPARGHFLCTNDNENGYSLSLYPAGDVSTAEGDLSYETDIPDNAGIAIFRTSDVKNFTLGNRLDAVGSTSEANTLYKEGTGYPALSTLNLEHALQRDLCGKSGSITTFGPCTTGGGARDTDDNASDFIYVETNGNPSGAQGRRLGAPGPEDSSSPIQSNALFAVNLLDPCVGSSSPPNRVRDFTPDAPNNSPFGTLDIRRTVTNATGQNVTRLRWRIIDLTTFPAPAGIADLRARTSTPVVVTVDRAPCGTETSTVTVQGTTLEQPPLQTNGGGFNSTLSSGTVTLQTPLADGDTIDVRFLLGIEHTGNFKFFINLEAITREPEVVPEQTLRPKPSTGAPVGPSVRSLKGLTALPSSSGGGASTSPTQAPKGVSTPPAKTSKGVSALPATTVKGGSKARREIDSREF
ncbi:MAG: hypothetical protein ACJ754_00935 [Pyrinomonadaceae bacterium]